MGPETDEQGDATAALPKRYKELMQKHTALLSEFEVFIKAEEVKLELADFLAELWAIKDTEEFRIFGFSSENQAAAWKKRIEEARGKLEADHELPPQIRMVPASLLSLGLDLVWSKGEPNENTGWNLEIIQNGLNWKMAD